MNREGAESFLGRGWAFPPAFDRASGTVAMAEGEEDVAQSLRILLATRVGERVLQPRYGCDLGRFLFEPLTVTLTTYIEALVRDAILYFEPRVVLERVRLAPDQHEGVLNITVEYRIPTTNRRGNLVYPLYLSEGAR